MVSKNTVASFPSIVGPTALEFPRPVEEKVRYVYPRTPPSRRSHGRLTASEIRTIYLYHVTLSAWRCLRFLDRSLQIGEESIGEWYRQPLKLPNTMISMWLRYPKKSSYCASDMDCRRTTEPIEVPSFLAHRIADLEYIDARISRAECNNGGWWGSEDIELGNWGFDCVGDRPRAIDDWATWFEVATEKMRAPHEAEYR